MKALAKRIKMNLRSSKKRNTQLFDLYWEDIIVSQVLPYVSIPDCCSFRCVSKTCLQIVNIYFARLKSLKLFNKGCSPQTFKVSQTLFYSFPYSTKYTS